MKKHNGWSYAPYKPLFFNTGDIYVCRVVPHGNSVHFEWLDASLKGYKIYVKERENKEAPFRLVGETSACEYDITGLENEVDYEFYVCDAENESFMSRVRLARTYEFTDCNAVAVNYLHPDDEVYSFSGQCLCSPSIVRHPDGFLLASMDVYQGGWPQNLTLIFRSDDDGATWHYVSELFPCFWGKMFIHKGELYMFGCSTEYGDIQIGKSTDGGKNWTEPTILFRGSNGKHGETGLHRNPQVVLNYKGRIWNTAEWGSWGRGYHAPMVLSADENADLLDADSWVFSEPVKYQSGWNGLPEGESSGNIEGCPVVAPDGTLYNIMRYDMTRLTPNHGIVMMYKVDTDNPEAPLKYEKPSYLPGNHSKFEIKLDEVSGKYYTIISRIRGTETAHQRNLLSLMSSTDLVNWKLEYDLIDRRNEDPNKIGFQYVDFIFEGEDLLFLCRTGVNNARNMHDTNYQTFHRVKNFRSL